tara:strand:- start:2103 stop:2870 length:768 start_codon:yes stop_codon:yes gene_type:complete
MFINNFDPVAFNIFSLEIRWYSLSYIFGLLIGWYYCKKITSNKIVSNTFDDFVSYLIVAIIVGGRLGYVIFYNPNYYLKNPLEILMIWNGGMSFHGALIGIIIASYLFGNKKKINNFLFLDLVAIASPIGIFLGRVSNFINSELYGRPTEIFWGVKFIKIDQLTRHPSQIYEAIFEGLILFMILNLMFKKFEGKPGLISSIFLIFYSTFRFFIEFTREPDSQIGFLIFNLTMGQIISIIFFISGITLFYLKNEKR